MKRLILALALATAALPGAALAAKPPVYTAPFSQVAAGGYDVVAYFTVGRPVKGDAKFATEWKGVR
ncbi:MAG: hypothetical protein K9G59_12085 [Caulobacter sp.]|nr:hypothetical protein [Caulobacter sp.]